MPVEKVKIKKIYQKEYKKFTAFNLLVDLAGEEDVWLNGYLGSENRKWTEGDVVEVDIWEKDDRMRYKVPDDSSKPAAGNHGPPPQSGSGVPNHAPQKPGDVSFAELKSLLIRTGKFLASMDEKLDGLVAKVEALESTGPPYPTPQSPEEVPDSTDPNEPPDYFKEMDDDLPF